MEKDLSYINSRDINDIDISLIDNELLKKYISWRKGDTSIDNVKSIILREVIGDIEKWVENFIDLRKDDVLSILEHYPEKNKIITEQLIKKNITYKDFHENKDDEFEQIIDKLIELDYNLRVELDFSQREDSVTMEQGGTVDEELFDFLYCAIRPFIEKNINKNIFEEYRSQKFEDKADKFVIKYKVTCEILKNKDIAIDLSNIKKVTSVESSNQFIPAVACSIREKKKIVKEYVDEINSGNLINIERFFSELALLLEYYYDVSDESSKVFYGDSYCKEIRFLRDIPSHLSSTQHSKYVVKTISSSMVNFFNNTISSANKILTMFDIENINNIIEIKKFILKKITKGIFLTDTFHDVSAIKKFLIEAGVDDVDVLIPESKIQEMKDLYKEKDFRDNWDVLVKGTTTVEGYDRLTNLEKEIRKISNKIKKGGMKITITFGVEGDEVYMNIFNSSILQHKRIIVCNISNW